jgi:hypothetical protein
MPAKKKGSAKAPQKPAAKKAGKAGQKAADKKKVKKALPKKVSPVKIPQRMPEPIPIRPTTPRDLHIEEHHEETGPRVECEHCLGAGKCTAGEPYDKGHHQMFGAKLILTSCFDCLEAAGEHRNSKKLVACRVCGGSGMVKA